MKCILVDQGRSTRFGKMMIINKFSKLSLFQALLQQQRVHQNDVMHIFY